MRTLNAVEIAQLAILGENGDTAIIVLELHNSGSSSRWGQQFPSLTSEHLNMLDETAFMTFPSRLEACETFQRLTLDCAENGTGGLIGGTITLVAPDPRDDDQVETIAWDLGEDTRPVLSGTTWKDEMIVERI